MAAEVLARSGVAVDVYERMPSAGRKLLMAGKGGLNITHNEPRDAFYGRYAARAAALAPILDAFDAQALRAWVHGLGIETFVGTSGRVFPQEMKAAPLLRAWLHRLRAAGVAIHVRHRWIGWDDAGGLRFETARGEATRRADATVLAMGGGSWPQLGSDATWTARLHERGVPIVPLEPANCGFDVDWTPRFRERFGGAPVKSVAASLADASGTSRRPGEFVVTEHGVEGGLVYAFSARLRDAIGRDGRATLELDLAPGRDEARLAADLGRARGSRSLSSHIQSRTGLKGVKLGLIREILPPEALSDPKRIAAAIKRLPLTLVRARPIAEAISSAGGVPFEALDGALMVRALPGVFCAGEMLDWEAPTGGYLLTACFATGRAAGRGALQWLTRTGQWRTARAAEVPPLPGGPGG
jgi:uncharacterized flavoprotein (TIGR03862 family)